MPFSFSLSTGNEYHPSGLGAWKVDLDEQGVMLASWHQLGQETRFGPFQLEKEANEQIWELISHMNLPNISSSERMGIPDEVMYTFTLDANDVHYHAWMWQGEIENSPPVRAVVAAINRWVTTHTGQSVNR